MNLKSYPFRIHSLIIVKDFHRQLRVKTFQMFDFILCFRQNLLESVHAFVQNQLAREIKTQRNCSKTPKSGAIKQMVNATPYIIEL